MSDLDLKRILEGALFASREPMSIYQMKKLFGNQKAPTEGMLREAFQPCDDYQGAQSVLLKWLVVSVFRSAKV